ncbi:unnamed protein product [Parnassius apollo]|uniref:(apollo) hypothetical protein n=1 Tax=Parnassius apollo TaxID=110799 RepID=A0A8S3XV57_PARAO|nr:unnamed protein product [Parnassius apollo]
MEADAYDYGGGIGNVSEEEATAKHRRPKSVIEMSTLAPLLLEAETIITEKSSGVHVHSSSQDEESILPAPRNLGSSRGSKKVRRKFWAADPYRSL